MIGFIGGGNMANAIIGGLIKSGAFTANEIIVYDVDAAKQEALKAKGIIAASSAQQVVTASSIVILAVKPAFMSGAIKGLETDGQTFVTIAAGLSIDFFKDLSSKIIRVMPNTPALVGEGMSVLCAAENVSEDEKATVEKIFSVVGKTAWLSEKLFHGVTAVSGSGPAYFFIAIEAMADAAVMQGIPRGLAYTLAAQTVLGTAKMVLETGENPGVLKDMVTSPAGTTIEALCSLENDGFRAAIFNAVNAAAEKSKKLI